MNLVKGEYKSALWKKEGNTLAKINKTNKRSTYPRQNHKGYSLKFAPMQVSSQSLFQKVQTELKSNQSYLNLILGLLIVLTAGVLLFNYVKKQQGNLGPAQQVTPEVQNQPQADATPNNLPGKYTVKEGDTLFSIAQNYYNDGYKYSQLVTANKLTDENTLAVGQVLDIPKLEETQTSSQLQPSDTNATLGIGGAVNQTTWGEAITKDTYTVVEGDWLSKIAGRSYGDIYAFDKIAKANNIPNPDLIQPGQVLTIPR